MEKEMMREMKWLMTPPTPFMWASWYMNQWDIFIEQQDLSLKPKFKVPSEESYQLFWEVMQMIDACYLDIESYQYKPRAIVISVMFLVLGKHFSEFTFSQIAENFPNTYWCH